MTQSAIVAKYITESDSVQSLLIGIALILCMAKAARNASSFLRKKVVLVQDEPVRKRRANLVFFVDTPINQRTSSPVDDKSPVDDLAYESFCQENREYVKNWKEERVNRQLLEMWHELGKEGQKEWVNQAEALDKLFEATDKTKVCKSIVSPKIRKTDATLCKHLTCHDSGLSWFTSEVTNKFYSFFTEYIAQDAYKSLTVDINTFKTQMCNDTNYVKKVLAEWIQAGDNSQNTRYKDLQAKPFKFISRNGSIMYETNLWRHIGSDGQKLWEDAYDSILHAYELFCQKVRRTDPEMSDVDEQHLSRMWELKVSNTIGTQPTHI